MPGRLDCLIALISASLVACGGVARPEQPSARAAECLLTPARRSAAVAARPARTAADRAPINVAIDQPIDLAHAPRPTNAAEQVVFAQVYETLVRVDCTGSVVPGLAASWRRAEGDGGWLFTLRPGARFHDGSPVTAHAVGKSLAELATPTARPELPHAAAPRVASVSVLSDDVLRVDLVDAAAGAAGTTGAARTDGPAAFASPELAVRKDVAGGRPLGSGSYEIAGATAATHTDGTIVELRPAPGVQVAPRPSGAQPAGAARLPLAFRLMPGGDMRNALDVGVDVLVTAHPDVIDYALARGSYVTAPLPWDAAHALFTPVAPDGAPAPMMRVPADARGALARDAVPGVARASSLETWTCPGSSAQASRGRRRPRIVFMRGDRVAAGVAERLVALGRTERTGWIGDAVPAARAATLTAAPLSAAELGASLRAGRDAGYVIRIDLSAPAACPPSSGRAALRAIPLVDTRKTAILRSGLEGVRADAEGTLDFAGAWWRAEPEARR